jgi:ABC-2 type transport system ATP-binding protein
MIEVKKICKQFGDLNAVNDVSFTAAPGKVFGLIGPNGAGKTTTIRMIMNILAPDSGSIMIDGHPLREQDKERIGYLPEERGLYKKVKVNDMLAYLGSLKGKDPQVIQDNIDYWLDRFALVDWKDHPIEELSKGMSQKVQFIASVCHDPQLILFDEPFAGLDPVSSDLLKESIIELGRKEKTILFSTHIMEHAERICHDIFLINNGAEVVSGSVGELKSRYGTNSVIMEFDGNGDFIGELPMVEQVIPYPRQVEVQLKPGGSSQELLQSIVGRVKLYRFEVATPSLHNIFVQLVGTNKEKTHE